MNKRNVIEPDRKDQEIKNKMNNEDNFYEIRSAPVVPQNVRRTDHAASTSKPATEVSKPTSIDELFQLLFNQYAANRQWRVEEREERREREK